MTKFSGSEREITSKTTNPRTEKIRHVGKVSEILEKYGYSSVEMWGDMLIDEKSTVSFAETKKRLPKNSSVVTTGIKHEKWGYNSINGLVTIENAIPFHEYTVTFLARVIWHPVQIYNELFYQFVA